METTETNVPAAPAAEPVIILDHEAQAYLRETGRWASFLAVMGFIFCGLILILAIFIGSVFSIMSRISPVYQNMPQTAGTAMSVFYILLDVLYFFFPFYLYRFSDRIKKGIVYTDASSVNSALSNLKSFFKLSGIVTIIVVSLYLIIFIIVLLIGVGAAVANR
ncbi:MAG: hypothetical protein JST19_15365 [Bacteroidetes bacterium]|nr:hypothetical protein [Bacteroidota bacterium]